MTSLIEGCPMKSETEFKLALNETVAVATRAGDLIVEWSRQAVYEVRQKQGARGFDRRGVGEFAGHYTAISHIPYFICPQRRRPFSRGAIRHALWGPSLYGGRQMGQHLANRHVSGRARCRLTLPFGSAPAQALWELDALVVLLAAASGCRASPSLGANQPALGC
jgi:hypothetical protein